MVKKKVTKKVKRKPTDPLSALNNLDKTISKAMKNMNASISVSIQIPTEVPKKKKGAKKKK